MSPLDVLVDVTALGTASGRRGIGRYQRGLLGALRDDRRVLPRALVRRGTELPDGVAPVVVARRAPARWAKREHELLLPWSVRRAKPQVFHSAGQELPRRDVGPWVHTLFDLIPLV